uniref:Uncharacterized protein n=1 Tax=Romanomermis culicivorax TaxID=13658 RepID=A0A915JZD8_ROMCU
AIEVERSHLQERVQHLEKQLEESSIARLALAADLDRIKSFSDEKDVKHNADMTVYAEKLAQISKNLDGVTFDLKQSEERCKRFETDYTKTNEDLIEMQTKYSDQLKRAETLETDVEDLNQKLSIAKSEILKLDANLRALMTDLKQQNDKLSLIDSIHEENLKQYKERCETLEARNESLSEEHQNLSNLLSMLEKSKFAEEGQTSSTIDIASLQDQSFQSLNKIIEALRSERSVKAKKLTEVEQDLFKYQQREKCLEAEIEKISADLLTAQKESE